MQTLFFDLDGTLIDSEPGIIGALVHAFGQMGQPIPPMAQLRSWIGPPLRDSFQEHFAGDAAQVTQALTLYRSYYDSTGWTEHSVFAGIPGCIAELADAGHRMAVVTSKNERSARRIIEHLPFGDYFAEVVGTSDDGTRRFKVDLIAEALRRLSLQPAHCTMIGDRRMDIEGAHAHGMRNIGVLWGFGDEAELRAAGAVALAYAPAELSACIGV